MSTVATWAGRQRRPVVPLSAVDHVIAGDGRFTAVKRIDPDDPYLTLPGYPGAFVVESVVQAARRCLSSPGLALAEVVSARLRAPLRAGDTLTFHPVFTESGPLVQVDAHGVRQDGETAATVTLRCGVVAADERFTLRDRPATAASAGALVDRVTPCSNGGTVEYTVRPTEPCYRHQLLGPYPPTLVLESFVRGCAALSGDSTVILRELLRVQVHGLAHPGQVLRHEIRRVGVGGFRGRTTADGRACLTVELADLRGEATTTS